MRKAFLLSFLLIPITASATPSLPTKASATAAVSLSAGTLKVSAPLRFEQHRPYAELTLTGPSGKPVRALFWLDTGGGALILSGPLAARLGLKPLGRTFKNGGNVIASTDVPRIRVGGMLLRLKEANAYLEMGRQQTLAGTGAEGAFPLRALRNYQVVLDYPHARLTIAEPGVLRPEGQRVEAHFSEPGFIAVTARVSGKPYGFLLDSGGQYCMVSQEALAEWHKQHPHWPHVSGVYGPADMLLGPMETSLSMLRIGAIHWGPFILKNVGSVSRPKGNYEQMMSKLTGRGVIGSIGGNVLRHFRVDIDYPNRRLYLKRTDTRGETPLDMVGVMLEPSDGGYVIAGVASEEKNLTQGDRLIRIGGMPIMGLTIAQIMRELSGTPGAFRKLTIERDHKTLSVDAKVIKIY